MKRFAVVMLATGCISAAAHRAKIAELDSLHAREIEAGSSRIRELVTRVAELERECEPPLSENTTPTPMAKPDKCADLKQTIEASLRPFLDEGVMKVVIRERRVAIAIAADSLFGRGATLVRRGAVPLVEQVARIVAPLPGVRIWVASYVDDLPFRPRRFEPGSGLSTQRAQSVGKLLADFGVNATVRTEPRFVRFVAPELGARRRAFDRRVEIVLVPD